MSLGFVLTWFIFACLWMIISLDNADFDQTDAEPCLSGIVGFAGKRPRLFEVLFLNKK